MIFARWPAWPFCILATLLTKAAGISRLPHGCSTPTIKPIVKEGNLSFEYVWFKESFDLFILDWGVLHLFLVYCKGRIWFVYLSVKVVLWFDRPSHSLTLDPSLCFLPVCASPGHAPRGILRCVSHHSSIYYL